MDTLVKFNSQTVGRDRILRLFQYGSKLLWSSIDKSHVDRELIVKLQNLEFTLGTTRKLLRFGRFLDTFYGALHTIHLPDLLVRITLTFARISQALYLLTDHAIWIGRAGLMNVDKAKWSRQSNKYWLFSILLSLIRDVYELWLAFENEMKIQNKKAHVQKIDVCSANPLTLRKFISIPVPLYHFARTHPDIVIDTIKNASDVWIPMSVLGYVKMSPGMIGLLGVISSVAGIMTIVYPTLKLQPS